MNTIKQNLKPKIFSISFKSIEGRLDPYYYNSALKEFTKTIHYNVVKIKDVVSSFHSGFGIGRQDQANDEIDGILQIRPTNLDNFGKLKFDKNVYIPKEFITSDKQLLKKGDIIFNNTNSQEWVGKTAFYDLDEKYAFSNHITVLKPIKENIEPEYLWIILNLYQQKKIFFSICTNWNNQSGVGLDLLKNLKIPLPSIYEQQKLIKIIRTGFEKKHQKETHAQELLESIDSLILNELGIQIPQKNKTLQSRIFTTSFKVVSGNRFDPKLFETHSQNLFKAINNTKFPKVPLKHLLIQSIAGDWGLDENEKLDENDFTKCLVIRATEFDNYFNLNLNNDRVKYRWIDNKKLRKLNIQPNDLLIEKSGGSPDQPVGRIAILRESVFNMLLGYSNFIHKIRVDENQIDPEYLFCFLKTIHNIKVTEIMQSQTNGIRNLIIGEYLNQKIVLPKEVHEQKRIAKEANLRRNKAKNLILNALQDLQTARNQIEKMILKI